MSRCVVCLKVYEEGKQLVLVRLEHYEGVSEQVGYHLCSYACVVQFAREQVTAHEAPTRKQ